MSELDSRADEPAGRSVVLSALRRSWVAIAAAAIVVGVLAYELSLLTPDRYEADSTVVLASTAVYNPLGEAQGGGDPERFLATQVSIAGSAAVLGEAAAAVGGGTTAAELAEDVTFTPSTASDAFTVTAAAETPDAAAATKLAAALQAEEARFHASVERRVAELGERAFKALRRNLPVSKQKINWDKVSLCVCDFFFAAPFFAPPPLLPLLSSPARAKYEA